MKHSSILLSTCLFFLCQIAFSQKREERYESEEAQEQQEYDKEFTYGLNWNTNGGIIGGISLKFAWQSKVMQTHYNQIGFEIVSVVHPKEIAVGSSKTGSSYIYGKEAGLYVVRANFGREIIIFNKAQEEGVQVSLILAGGPSLGYKKPYFIYFSPSGKDEDVMTVPYKAHLDENNIYGAAGILTGFDQMTCHFGTHVKTSLNFEFGKFRSNVTGVELGIMYEAYLKEMINGDKLVLVSKSENRSWYTSLFLTLYLGFR